MRQQVGAFTLSASGSDQPLPSDTRPGTVRHNACPHSRGPAALTQPITIRPEQAADAPRIAALHRAAFDGAEEARIVDGLRGSRWWIDGGSLVATDADGAIVGHVLLSAAEVVDAEDIGRPIWLLGPVGVPPAEQRHGIGSRLIRAALTLAAARGQQAVCLVGHADYYPRFGFEPARPLGIEPPLPWPDENWLVVRLPAWDGSLRGVARLAPGFAST